MKLLHRYLLCSLLALPALFPRALLASQSIDPVAACHFLSEQRFRGALEYKPNRKTGVYSCSSLRKPIDRGEPLGSDLRYQVLGTASEARKISLQLRMNSPRISTPVVRQFQRYADIIYQKVFAEPIPPEISDAMLASLRGEWRMHGYLIKLNRIHDKAFVYELIFSIEK